MNITRMRRSAAAIATAAVLPLVVTACGGDSGSDSGSDSSSSKENKQDKKGKQDQQDSKKSPDAQAADGPFGPGCKAVPKNGKGSFDAMAKKPVATAASNNPALSTLTSAVKKAGLVDTLNNAKDITVFAPVNSAFEKVPKEDLNALMADKKKLTNVLTYHVVGKRLAPSDLKSGTYKTLQGDKLTVSGSGEDYTVNDGSKVVCGNVQTANATVYLVDTVLMPKK